MANRRNDLDEREIARRYEAGETEQVIARSLSVSRNVIARVLSAQGVTRRTMSESHLLRARNQTPEQRRAQSQAAHDAVRGVSRPIEELERKAQTNQKKLVNVSETENVVRDALERLGVAVVPQKAIGKYNVDLCIGDSLAVEILGGHWHSHKSHGDRVRFLLDEGFTVAYVWVSKERPLVVTRLATALIRLTPKQGYFVLKGDGTILHAIDRGSVPDKPPY